MLCDVIFTLLFSYTMYYIQRQSMRSYFKRPAATLYPYRIHQIFVTSSSTYFVLYLYPLAIGR